MRDKEKTLIADLLDIASEKFSNNICNDLDDSVYCGWDSGEKYLITQEYWEWLDSDVKKHERTLPLNDSLMMDFMSYKIRKQNV